MQFKSWLAGLRAPWPARRGCIKRRPTQVFLVAAEHLEPRALLSGNSGSTPVATIALNTTTSEVVITGTSYSDIATVSAPTATTVTVRVVTGSKAVESTFATTAVSKITFNAGARDDRLPGEAVGRRDQVGRAGEPATCRLPGAANACASASSCASSCACACGAS